MTALTRWKRRRRMRMTWPMCPTLSTKTTKTLKLSSHSIALTSHSSARNRHHHGWKCEQRNQRPKQRHKVSVVVLFKWFSIVDSAQRLSLIELTKLTREMGNSIERTLDTVSSLPKVTIPAAKDEQQRCVYSCNHVYTNSVSKFRQERRKLSNELDEIIETCHAHLTDMIDEMEAVSSV